MTVYAVKIALRGISPIIWRQLRLLGSTSIADLHYIIQMAMGWDDEYSNCFHIYGKDYGIAYEGGMSFSANPHDVKLDDFTFNIGDSFTHCYNFYDHWSCDIRIEDIQLNDDSTTPKCTGGKGRLVNNTPCLVMKHWLSLMHWIPFLMLMKQRQWLGMLVN
jgi:hypothetical protein